MPDNLVIDIGVDTKGLTAGIAVVKAQLRDLQKEVKAASDEFVRTGDATRINKVSEAVDQLTGQLRRLQQQQRQTNQAHRESAAGVENFRQRLSAIREPLGQIREGFDQLVQRTFPSFGEIAALSIAGVTAELLKFTTEANEAIRINADLAQSFGTTSGQIQTLQLGAAAAGASFEEFTGHMERSFKQFSQAQQQAAFARGQLPGDPTAILRGRTAGVSAEAAGNVAVLRGITDAATSAHKSVRELGQSLNTVEGGAAQTVNVLRGGSGAITNMDTAAKQLGIDVNAFAHNFEGYRQYIAAFVKALDLKDPATRAALAADQWGKHWVEQLRLARVLVSKELDGFAEELQKSGLVFGEYQQQQAEAFEKANARLTLVFGFMKSIVGNIIGEAFTPFFIRLAQLIENNTGLIKEWAESARDNLKAGFVQAEQIFRVFAEGVRLATLALRGFIAVLDPVSAVFNKLFGTQFTGAGLLATVILLRILGIFRLISSSATAVVALFGRFRAAVSVIGTLATAAGWRALLAALGPAGWLIVGVTTLIALYERFHNGAAAANNDIANSAANAKKQVDILRGATAQPAEERKGAPGGKLVEIGAPGASRGAGLGGGGVREIPLALGPEAVAHNKMIAEQIAAQNKTVADTAAEDSKKAAEATTDGWASAAQSSAGFIDSIVGGIRGIVKAAEEAAKAIAGIGLAHSAETAAGPGGFAGGGYVRGSGVGDTVPAMLMPGEFVTRASAVRHYGAGFFAALNQQRLPAFDFGGLVDAIHARPGPHFAEGGMVGSAPATPVHLHIGNGSFPMSASGGVAAALVIEARRSQMVSAGVKPSWYGR
jgi:hypothetical protein